jgi:hypothetical protein
MFTIIETPSFLNVVDKYLDENALFALKTHMANHPDAGEVVPGSGGVRKLRWTRPGMGKRGISANLSGIIQILLSPRA